MASFYITELPNDTEQHLCLQASPPILWSVSVWSMQLCWSSTVRIIFTSCISILPHPAATGCPAVNMRWEYLVSKSFSCFFYI